MKTKRFLDILFILALCSMGTTGQFWGQPTWGQPTWGRPQWQPNTWMQPQPRQQPRLGTFGQLLGGLFQSRSSRNSRRRQQEPEKPQEKQSGLTNILGSILGGPAQPTGFGMQPGHLAGFPPQPVNPSTNLLGGLLNTVLQGAINEKLEPSSPVTSTKTTTVIKQPPVQKVTTTETKHANGAITKQTVSSTNAADAHRHDEHNHETHTSGGSHFQNHASNNAHQSTNVMTKTNSVANKGHGFGWHGSSGFVEQNHHHQSETTVSSSVNTLPPAGDPFAVQQDLLREQQRRNREQRRLNRQQRRRERQERRRLMEQQLREQEQRNQRLNALEPTAKGIVPGGGVPVDALIPLTEEELAMIAPQPGEVIVDDPFFIKPVGTRGSSDVTTGNIAGGGVPLKLGENFDISNFEFIDFPGETLVGSSGQGHRTEPAVVSVNEKTNIPSDPDPFADPFLSATSVSEMVAASGHVSDHNHGAGPETLVTSDADAADLGTMEEAKMTHEERLDMLREKIRQDVEKRKEEERRRRMQFAELPLLK